MTEAAISMPVSRPRPAERPSVVVYALLAALTLASLVPIWAYRYFPTTDGPSHLENAYVLRHWFEADRIFHQLYKLNIEPVPNWTTHLTLALLMLVVPPLAAEKILLTGYVVLFAGSIVYLLRAMGERHVFHALLAFPLMYSFLLMMGFFNFAVSLPLAFLVIGYWWRHRGQALRRAFVVRLDLLLVLLYFCHIVSLLFALGSVLGLAALHHRFRLRRLLPLAAALLPACVLPLYFVLSRGVAPFGEPAPARGWDLVRGNALVSHDPRSFHVGIALTALVAGLGLVTLAWEKTGLCRGTFRPRLELRDGFLLVALACVVLYFVVPENLAGGGFVRERIALLPFLALLPWLTVHYARPLKAAVGALAAALTVAQLVFTVSRFETLNQGLADYTSGTRLVGRNDVLLPLSFEHIGLDQSRICTYLHAAGLYCIATGAVELANYEARMDYFPLRYRRHRNPYARIGPLEAGTGDVHPERSPLPVDFILLWYPPPDFPARAWIHAHYEPVHQQGKMILLRRRSRASPR